MSTVITYYSYKGGVGRSMSLANTAVFLSKWGYKTLIIDWDLEAPGLEHFFKPFINTEIVKEKNGVIDLLDMTRENRWQEALIPVFIPNNDTPIHLISSGKRDENYFLKVRNFNVDDFYAFGGGEFIERLRESWKKEYDFILVDSRTGVTEIGGICAIQLPDQVVMLFTATDQGFEGTLDIANRALKAQQKLPYDRQKLIFIPILTKFDTQAEFELSQKWIAQFADKLSAIYKDWLPISLKRDEFIRVTKIPYITYFSFGEKLPALEQSVTDTSGLAYSYENLASIIANGANNTEALVFNRDKFISDSLNVDSESAKVNNNKKNKKNIKLFISYSQKDRILKSELAAYLSLLSTKHNISIWSDDNLLPGDIWDSKIEENLINSDIILLLISPDYLDNKFTKYEFEKAMGLNKRIVPIILRSTDMTNTNISKFIVLPRSMKALNTFDDMRQGFSEITNDLEKLIISMTGNK